MKQIILKSIGRNRLFLLLFVALTSTISIAQTNQVVWLNGKVLYGHPISSIDSMTYDLSGMLLGDTLSLILPRTIEVEKILYDTVVIVRTDTIYIDVCSGEEAKVYTDSASHIGNNFATLSGKVVFKDYDAITERGFCYATHSVPTTEDMQARVGKGTGSFTITITGLDEKTHYYCRAYAINAAGVSYGEEVEFTTIEKSTPGGGSETSVEGCLSGRFSVSADRQVSFSKGNLQYQASTNTWRFAENQYDYVGEDNKNISPTYSGWIDLFGWGTSGYDNTANDPAAINFQPWSSSIQEISQIKVDSTQNCDMQPITGECGWDYTYMDGSKNKYGYGPSIDMADANLVGTSANYDWGVYNAISNGGNQAGLWRTLSYDEWYYLLHERKNAEYLYSVCTVNGVKGVIIMPDNFSKPSSISWTPKANNYGMNAYTLEQWKILEMLGCVFLPYCCLRYALELEYHEKHGGYWSSTSTIYNYDAEYLYISEGGFIGVNVGNGRSRANGYCVRLILNLY